MIFSSTIFLFIFLPIFLIIYFLSPSKFKNLVLLIFSLLFYSFGEGKFVLLLMFSTIIDFQCGKLIERGNSKTGLIISIFFNLGILCYFKYLNFGFENFNKLLLLLGLENTSFEQIPNLALPIGISFFTFQTMSYTIDIYRKKIEANKNFLQFATYVTMFPQLVAGPIVRYSDIEKDLKRRDHSIDQISSGVEKFIIGLAKKLLLADSFGVIADGTFAQNINDLSSAHAWLGILAYTLQIYYDFSGYSDMAIGLGRILGFDIPENFLFPYKSKNIREFWRRWHISLSSWFRDYVYIPLGGNRRGKLRTFFNLSLVFLVTGLWHGAAWNFVFWGIFHGFFLLIERAGLERVLRRMNSFFQHLYTLIVVMVGWVFFRTQDFSSALLYLYKMFVPSIGIQGLNEYLTFLHCSNINVFMITIGLIFCLPVYEVLKRLLVSRNLFWLNQVFLILLFVISVFLLSVDSYNPFIYFKF